MSLELSLTRLDRDGALVEAAERVDRLTRAGFLAGALGGSALALGARPGRARAAAVGAADRAILNYALVLEYLQAAFYTEAEREGALQGHTARAAAVVGGVERAHVQAFRSLLGRAAVKPPSFDFQGTTEEQKGFLKTAVAFEDLAVAAYKGQAPNVSSNQVLASALAIHSVEARHAAWMRYLSGVIPAARAFDEPESKSEIDRVVRSTGFISAAPRTKRRRRPRYTG